MRFHLDLGAPVVEVEAIEIGIDGFDGWLVLKGSRTMYSTPMSLASARLLAPGIPDVAEKELMKKLVGTYGKTWHTWHTDVGKSLPLGVPQLMMGFTADGQQDPAMVAARDQRFGIDSAKKRKERQDIAGPTIDPGADAWQKGKVMQISDPTECQHEHESATKDSHPKRTDVNARSNKP